MVTNIELYEALKSRLGEEGARLLAERFPRSEELVTKADLRAELAELKADMRGWMLAFFVPLWIGVYGTLAAVVALVVVR